jgi:hypothetical protein
MHRLHLSPTDNCVAGTFHRRAETKS